MTTDEFYEKEIINYYSWIETIVKNSNSFGYTDINISLESLVAKLLKLLDLGDYTNCNSINICYPTIDLFDDNLKTGIQVTNDCTSKKIKETILGKAGYQIKFFFLNSNYNPQKRTINKYENFDENDILNFKKCLILAKSNNKLQQLYEFFKSNIILPIDTECISIKDGYDIYEQNFFLNKMKEICNRFVPTSITSKCLKHLENNNLLILTGNPGVGKTYNSYFLTAKLMEKGYILLHSPNNNLKDTLKKYNAREKFVLFIDDVFGSNEKNFMINLGEEEIVSLIESKSDNLKIIFNSRSSIFKDVNNQFDKIERLKLKPFVIEVSDFTCLEKARILIKHLECNNISKEKIKQLFVEEKYLFGNNYPSKQKIYKILFHKNYNPRAIDLATNDVDDGSGDFVNYILRILDNPFLIYEHSYNSNLDDNDREILRIIYMKSGSSFDNEICIDEIFKFGAKLKITTDAARLSLRKLEKSFICQYYNKNGNYVCKFYNPSILDFCSMMFESSYDMTKYIDLIENPNDLKNIIKNNKIDDLKKMKKIQELKYKEYGDIKKINPQKIKSNRDFVNYIINDIFENQNYYSDMDYFCNSDYVDDSTIINQIKNSKKIDKYISFFNGEPKYIISKRILQLINNFSDEKRKEILNSISYELHSEIVSSVEDYVYQTVDIDECQENILEEQYTKIRTDICEEFKNYLKINKVAITLSEMKYIFDLIQEYDYSDYEESIETHFNENQDERDLSNDEIETIAYLKEYSANL